MGENTSEIGIVTEGSVVIENNDILGNSIILNKLETGDVFAELMPLQALHDGRCRRCSRHVKLYFLMYGIC